MRAVQGTRKISGARKGFFYALIGNVLVSTNFVTAKHALTGFDPGSFSLVWTAAAAVYTLVLLAVLGRLSDLAIPRRALPRMIVLGAATAAGMVLGWAGLARLDPAFSALLWRFAPVITMGLGVFFLKERLTLREVLAAAVMVAGGLWSVGGRWEAVAGGVILTLASCLANAVQMMSAKQEVAQVHPDALVFYRTGIATIFLALWVSAGGGSDFDAPGSCWAATLVGGFLGPCASFLFTFRAYRYWDLSRVALMATVQPLWVAFFTFLFAGAVPTARDLSGGAVILTGAVWMGWIHLGGKKVEDPALETP